MPEDVFSLATHTLMKHSDIKLSSPSSETTPALSVTESFLQHLFQPRRGQEEDLFWQQQAMVNYQHKFCGDCNL